MKFGSRKLSFALICYCTFICIASITRSLASSSPNDLLLLGVAPQDYKFYEDGFSSSAQKVKCKDGLKQFTKSQFNDDFCDCFDGSDEPGTSACPNGKFYCKNAGHVPLSIFSSRVNDGICDCCDGSDEYDGKVKCTNTCWESGKAARDKLKKKIATYQQGATIRKREVEQAKVEFAREEAELSKLKSEEKILKGLVEQLKDRKEQIEKAEEKERLQKEKAEKERKEAEEKERLQKEKEEKERTEMEEEKHQETSDGNEADISGVESTGEKTPDQIDVLEDSSSSQDVGDDNGSLPGGGHAEESQDKGAVKDAEDEADHPEENSSHENHATEDPESLSREELGRRIASRWTREKTEEETKDSHADSSSDHENSEHSDETNYEEDNSYESDDEEHKYDNYDTDSEEHNKDVHDEDHSTSSYNSDDEAFDSSDIDSSSSPSWLEKIRQTVKTILSSVSYFQGPVDLSEAEHVRKEYDESDTKLSKIQSRISSLTKKLKQDFGPEKQFYSFYGQCFEIKQNKYVYKICPFKEASQVEGYSTTRLGNWDKFEDSYRIMQFSNGDKCWNGPDRSLKVKLRCGLKNEATDVDEPSRCEYLALLATPAVCHEDKLKELEDKLEMMNTENQHQTHDEL